MCHFLAHAFPQCSAPTPLHHHPLPSVTLLLPPSVGAIAPTGRRHKRHHRMRHTGGEGCDVQLILFRQSLRKKGGACFGMVVLRNIIKNQRRLKQGQ